jgi:ferrochelatase
MANEGVPSALSDTGGGLDVPGSGRRRRVAIVLFNLGGPDRPESIRPFLLNLFQDPAILRVPFFIRPFLARYIANARVAGATANYALLGGRSPLLGLTQEQAAALEAALPELDAKCFIAMRYWHPFSMEAARAVKVWAPDEIVLLPLYPHYSTTTTGSSVAGGVGEDRAAGQDDDAVLLPYRCGVCEGDDSTGAGGVCEGSGGA